jgi:hypothetical protein
MAYERVFKPRARNRWTSFRNTYRDAAIASGVAKIHSSFDEYENFALY